MPHDPRSLTFDGKKDHYAKQADRMSSMGKDDLEESSQKMASLPQIENKDATLEGTRAQKATLSTQFAAAVPAQKQLQQH